MCCSGRGANRGGEAGAWGPRGTSLQVADHHSLEEPVRKASDRPLWQALRSTPVHPKRVASAPGGLPGAMEVQRYPAVCGGSVGDDAGDDQPTQETEGRRRSITQAKGDRDGHD